MSEKTKVWRAGLGVDVSPTKGHSTFCHYGWLTECGQWVDGNSVRWPMSADWALSEREALAKLAPQIASIGTRMLTQAVELMAAEEVQP
jgi:hypothetical protein